MLRALASLIVAASMIAIASAALAQSTSPSVIGQWSSDSPWPTVGVHLVVLPDGRTLTWGEDIPAPGATAFPTYVVSIPSGSTDTSNVQQLIINDDIFCSGHTFMADGRLFVAGGGDQPAPTNGTGRVTTDIFDPSTSTWSSGPAMSEARWYPTVTTLGDGELAIQDGSEDANFTPALTPDVVSADGTSIRSLTGVSGTNVFYNYPRSFVAPNGDVFSAGMEQVSRYLNTTGTGSYTVVGNSNFGQRAYGTAVMYDPGKILIAGGAIDSSHPPTATAEVIDLNSSNPAWSYVSSMNFARVYLNGTILADGTVLISGGTSSTGDDDASGAVLPAEIWNPSTQTFTTVASMPHYRLYHSATGLLPDGRVISVGTTPANGTGGGIAYQDADFYSPPYLFNGSRPTISSAPSSIVYGQAFTVGTPDAANITAVNLIAFGSTTHHFNFHQRINRLSFTQGSNSLTVTPPSDSNLAPPGPYMMFLINSSGVPSIASTVLIGSGGATPTPTATGSSTPTPTATPSSVVAITSPANGATVSGTVSIDVSANSSVSWVNVYIDGNYFASSPPYTFSWDSTTVANGSHTISVTGNNSSGVVGRASVTVTVANGVATPTPTPTGSVTPTPTPTPTATPSSVVKITSPANGATVSGTVSIAVSANSSVSWVNVYIDGNYFASSPPYTFSWDSTTVANGSHTISVAANNSSGVIGRDSITVNVAN